MGDPTGESRNHPAPDSAPWRPGRISHSKLHGKMSMTKEVRLLATLMMVLYKLDIETILLWISGNHADLDNYIYPCLSEDMN